MHARRIDEGIDWVGAIDWERRLFDELIPVPDGTSYNAYLVRGRERTALIDAVDPLYAGTLRSRLASAGVGRIDYVVSQHAEQDHSGAIPRLLAEHPEAVVLVTDKGKRMLTEHLGIPAERMRG
jgi:flavorubredoxin